MNILDGMSPEDVIRIEKAIAEEFKDGKVGGPHAEAYLYGFVAASKMHRVDNQLLLATALLSITQLMQRAST